MLFARPLPAFAARINVFVTWCAAQWLMGPCTIEDLGPEERDASVVPGDGAGQQLLVHRCRFLDEAKCASVCVQYLPCTFPVPSLYLPCTFPVLVRGAPRSV